MIALKYLGDKLISQLLKKELQKYEYELQEKVTLLKTSLSIYAEEQNISNKRIDNQKSNAIHTVHIGISRVIESIVKIVTGSHYMSDDIQLHISFYHEWAEKGHAATIALSDSLVENAIYFDEETYKQIVEFNNISLILIANFLKIIRKHISQCGDNNMLMKKIEKNRIHIKEIHNEKLSIMNYELTKKFRNILGIEKIN